MIKINWNNKFDGEHIEFDIARARVEICIGIQIPFEMFWGYSMGVLERVVAKEIKNESNDEKKG